jgi:hypothetical protein
MLGSCSATRQASSVAHINSNYQRVEAAREVVSSLHRVCDDASLHYAVIKGFALSEIVYGSPYARALGDIDILIDRESAYQMHEELGKLGYFQKAPSSADQTATKARAYAALYAVLPSEHSTPFPVERFRDSGKYLKYGNPYNAEAPAVELHYSLPQMSAYFSSRLLRKRYAIETRKEYYYTLQPIESFLLLLANTYENSESLVSNLWAFDFKLRDYVDLKCFFERYRQELDWTRVEAMIREAGIAQQAAVVLSDLGEILGEDITEGCLSSVCPQPSKWGMSLLMRMLNHIECRKNALRIIRKKWAIDTSERTIPVFRENDSPAIDSFLGCGNQSDILFLLSSTDTAFIITWQFADANTDSLDSLLLQAEFVPLVERLSYTSYKSQLFLRGGVFVALGHSTQRYRPAACIQDNAARLKYELLVIDGRQSVKVEVPFDELGCESLPESGSFCVRFGIYSHHYANFYHEYSLNSDNYKLHLLDTSMSRG